MAYSTLSRHDEAAHPLQWYIIERSPIMYWTYRMNKTKSALLFFLTAAFTGVILIGCGGKNTSSSDPHKDGAAAEMTELRKLIDEKNDRFTQAHITGDTAFLNNIFTPDARVFAPNTDVVTGRSAIAALNLQFIQYGIKDFREVTTALYGNEEYLINEGKYSMVYGKEKSVDEGKFINIWKKTDGEWKLYSNIWNSSPPAASGQ